MRRNTGAVGRIQSGDVVALPGVEMRLSAEQAIRAAVDTQIFAGLRMLEPLDGGRAVQGVYVALIRRLPNVVPDRRRISIDSGYSESSVKRAIGLLESCGLMQVERILGRSSIYHLADIRLAGVASECLSKIRKLSRRAQTKSRDGGRVTSEPALTSSRSISEPSPRVSSEPRGGPQVVHKVTSKNQNKQQTAAGSENDVRELLETVLRRWGLTSASYLVEPGHERAISILAANQEKAAILIDRTMRKGSWTDAAGVGARVAFLRENVQRVAAQLESEAREVVDVQKRAYRRAAQLADTLTGGSTVMLDDISNERFEILLRRGLERLDEGEDVIRVLAESEDVRQSVVAAELEREMFEHKVRNMPAEEFRSCCERLFLAHPGLKRLYAGVGAEGRGLMVCLLEFLWKERSEANNATTVRKEAQLLHHHADSNEGDAA